MSIHDMKLLSARFCLGLALCAVVTTVGCTGADVLFGPLPIDGADDSLDLALTIVQPSVATTAAPGAAAVIQWADIAEVPGTVVRVTAQRRNDLDEDIGDPIELVGDGTPGSGRDALPDGDSDVFIWDFTGVRVGDYVIIAVIETPDGRTIEASSRDLDRGTNGFIELTTPLPVPTLTFTAPGVDDETVTGGSTFTITWTDNGTSNSEAMLVLGLDTDDDHENGNEIVLLRDEPLSANGDDGAFVFSFIDADGGLVPEGDYTVFTIVDDGANDPVIEEATGLLIVNP